MNKSFVKDYIALYSFFSLAVLFTYVTAPEIGIVFQIILLVLFWRSNKIYFWLALVFIIETSPGFLFNVVDDNHTFALFRGTIAGNLYFWIPFIFVTIYKSYNIKRYRALFLKSNIYILGIYFIILIVLFGAYKFTTILRLLLPWTLLFVLPRLFKEEEDYVGFFKLLFSFVPFVLLTQFYKIYTGLEFATVFGGVSSHTVGSVGIEEAGTAVRPVYGIFLPFLSLWGACYFLILKKNYFSKNYLYLILGLSIFSVFLSATRSWMVASVFITFYLFILLSTNPIKSLVRFGVPIVLLALIINFFPLVNKQFDFVIDRFETIELLMQGDLTAGGTLKRFDVRGPRVMSKFYEYPITGWGFGDEASKYSDGHVGHQNMLMHTGIIGYIFFLALWLNFIFKLIKRHKYMQKYNPYKKTPLILIAFLLSTIIIHTSVQWYNYLVTFETGFAISFLFSFASFAYWESIAADFKILNNYKPKNVLKRN